MKKRFMLAMENEDTQVDPAEDPNNPDENLTEDEKYFAQQELSINEAKEKVDEIRNNEEMEQVNQDGEVVEAAMESMQNLLIYRDVLRTNTNISNESFANAIGLITKIRADFGYNSDRLATLQNNEYDRGIAIESVGETIKAFFRAIKNWVVNLFNSIKNWINKFFGAYVEYNHRKNATLKAVSEAILQNRKKVKKESDGKVDLSNNTPDYVQLDIPQRKFLTINAKQPENYLLDIKAVTSLIRTNDNKTVYDTVSKMFGAEYFDFCAKAIAGKPANPFHFDPVNDTAIKIKPIGNYKGGATPFGYGAVVNGPFLGDIGFVTEVMNKDTLTTTELFESVLNWSNKTVVMSDVFVDNKFRNVRDEEITAALKCFDEISTFFANKQGYFDSLNKQCLDLITFADNAAQANPGLIDPNNVSAEAIMTKYALASVKTIPNKIQMFVTERLTYVDSVGTAWLKYLQEIAKIENPSGK